MSALAQEAAAASAVQRNKGRLSVDLADPAFTDAVVKDLNRIRLSAAGRALFHALAATGCTVSVVKPNPPLDPPNAWTRRPEPKGGREAPILVVYDPADWPGPRELSGLPSDVILFGRLEHALAIATGTLNLVETDEAVSPEMATYLRERCDRPEPDTDEAA